MPWATLLLLHGTGGDENDMLGIGEHLAPGANLLSLRGRVLENGMPRFFRRFKDGTFDYGDLKFQTFALIEFVRSTAEEYGFDPQRVVAVGYSNGANIATSILLHNPYELKAAVLFRPMVPFTPMIPLKLDGKPVFISSGKEDHIATNRETKGLEKLLRDLGGDVTLNWTEAGHELTPKDIEVARMWLESSVH